MILIMKKKKQKFELDCKAMKSQENKKLIISLEEKNKDLEEINCELKSRVSSSLFLKTSWKHPC